jgi:antirestriction protein ArdC/phage/plasmid primase-like uncharacterized protein
MGTGIADYKSADGTKYTYDQVLQLYFASGAIRPAFGGQDRILGFDVKTYTVTAQAVDVEGNVLPDAEGRVREHGTLPAPGSRELNTFLREQGLEPLHHAERLVFRRQQGLRGEPERPAGTLEPETMEDREISHDRDELAYEAADGTKLTYDQVLRHYFAPGAIRPSVGDSRDRILSFELARYRVTAQAVDKEGNPLPGLDGRVRSHSTLPAPGSRVLSEFLREQGIEPLKRAERAEFRRHLGLEPEAPEAAPHAPERTPASTAAAAAPPGDEKVPQRAVASEYAKEVAGVIIEQLRRGTAPWVKPWEPGQVPSHPMNPVTGKDYRGGNALWLMVQENLRGYGDPRWMTFRQAQNEGACVKKGEKGTRIQYWLWSGDEPVIDEKTGHPKTDEKGEVITQRVQYERPRVFTAVVFNATQIDGLPPLEKKVGPSEWDRHQRAEGILSASGANITHVAGDRAFYNVLRDQVVLPEREQFKSGDGYYATALHELAHWTGAASRLDRDLTGTFGSEDYAREELRAEIASFMIGTRVGVGHDPASHASYVASWIKALEQDPREVFRAAADAEMIADFVQQFDRTVEKPAAAEQATPVLVEGAKATEAASPKEATSMAAERTNLAVPYAERAEAKAAGARWDRAAKVWFAPKGTDLAPLARWMASEKSQSEQPQKPASEKAAASTGHQREAGERTYLAVPYREKNDAKAAGAEWDKGCKAWFVPPGVSIEPFAKWMPKARETVVDPFAEFDQAVRKAGLKLPDGERPAMDGQWHRVPVEGDKPGEKSGAYRGYTDGRPAGFIENHKAGTRTNWASKQAAPVLTEAQKTALAAETAQRRAEREATRERGYEAVAASCKARWEQATPATTAHAYLQKKDVPPFGLRVSKDGRLLVPLHDTASGKLVSLQSIGPDGRKSFEKGGRVSGASFRLDPAQFAVRKEKDGLRWGPSGAPPSPNKTVVIAEGYATAATVARALGVPTYVAFNASNLAHVAKELRQRHPEAMICIASDNDHRAAAEGRTNVGWVKAEAAAKAVDGHVLLPEFPKDSKGSDWNDLEKSGGREAVRSALEAGLAAAVLVDQARRETQTKTPPGRAGPEKSEELPPELDFRKYGSWDGR